MVREGLAGKVTSADLKEARAQSMWHLWRECARQKEQRVRGPEAGVSLVCSKNREEAVRLEGSERRQKEGPAGRRGCGGQMTSATLTGRLFGMNS